MPQISDIIAFLERLAPLDLAEEWDNVGLLLGDRAKSLERVLTCLTLTPDVAREAIERKAGLIVTHHPILFRAVKRLTAGDPHGRMLLDLIAAGVAIFSPHTAYDSAPEGINQQLALALGLVQIEPLRPLPTAGMCKIVCFIPRSHLAPVQEALWSAGAGVIGEYSKCSFVLDGTGSFEGSAAANPAVGERQQLEQVAEARLEVVCPEARLAEALRRLRGAHPYEEPACDVYPLKTTGENRGSGRVGLIKPADAAASGEALSLSDFVELVKRSLRVEHVSVTGDLQRTVSRVAIACGSGGEFLPAAIARGCDVLLTGEARFHSALEARESGIGLVLAGHYATERPAMEHLAHLLAREFAGLKAWASETESDPLHWR